MGFRVNHDIVKRKDFQGQLLLKNDKTDWRTVTLKGCLRREIQKKNGLFASWMKRLQQNFFKNF